jgi:hypothetical protein
MSQGDRHHQALLLSVVQRRITTNMLFIALACLTVPKRRLNLLQVVCMVHGRVTQQQTECSYRNGLPVARSPLTFTIVFIK